MWEADTVQGGNASAVHIRSGHLNMTSLEVQKIAETQTKAIKFMA